jgi:predicted nucleic acid-binding protein
LILIDTSAFIEFLNHTGSAYDKEIEDLIRSDKGIAIADITVTEILQGIKNDKEFNEIQRSLLAFPVYALKNTGSYIAAAELYRKCRKKGLTVRSTIDVLISQIALENNLFLFHNDKDFDNIAKVCALKIYKPEVCAGWRS